MSIEQEDIDKIVSAIQMDHERETGKHGHRMMRLGTMSMIVVTIAITGHYFHVEVIAKIGEVAVSCLYSFVMDLAQEGKDWALGDKIVSKIKIKKKQ